MGVAVPHHIGRHAHPATKTAPDLPVAETGIDYLRLVQTARDAERAHDIVNFTALTSPDITHDEDETGDGTR
jgi:putative transposase